LKIVLIDSASWTSWLMYWFNNGSTRSAWLSLHLGE
jgi:hypothetical protein